MAFFGGVDALRNNRFTLKRLESLPSKDVCLTASFFLSFSFRAVSGLKGWDRDIFLSACKFNNTGKKLSELILFIKCWSELEEMKMRFATPTWNLENVIYQ